MDEMEFTEAESNPKHLQGSFFLFTPTNLVMQEKQNPFVFFFITFLLGVIGCVEVWKVRWTNTRVDWAESQII